MTETVTAPEATTPVVEAPTAKQPVTLQERITKAMSKDMPAAHQGFVDWMKANGDVDIDIDTVLATQSLYSVWRGTPEFQEIKDNAPVTTKVEALPKTKAEAEAALKKAQDSKARAAKTAQRAEERAAKIQAMLASLDSGETAEAEPEAPATDETLEESF